jgi:hypothetical protein
MRSTSLTMYVGFWMKRRQIRRGSSGRATSFGAEFRGWLRVAGSAKGWSLLNAQAELDWF